MMNKPESRTLHQQELRGTGRGRWTAGLHIFVIVGFAVAQPLFDLLARQAEFFIFQDLAPVDIVVLVFVLSVLLPLSLIGLEEIVGLISSLLRRGVHHALLALGVALTILPLLQPLSAVHLLFPVSGAVVLGMYTARFYDFFAPVRLFFSLLSPAALIFPLLFLFASPVFRLVFPMDASVPAARVQIADPPPIIFIILDEFPTTSLMNEHHQIDAARYPNFAALASNATWFRNATTVSNGTHHAVPAILTGNYPEPDRLPHAVDHPSNLFTLLAGTYDLKASGLLTQLCPTGLCPQERPSMGRRLSLLLSDLTVIYLHLLLQPNPRDGLPSPAHQWNGSPLNPLRTSFSDRRQQGMNFLRTIQETDRPSLYFLHLLLPHAPFQYLPSGREYLRGGVILFFDPNPRRRAPDSWKVSQDYQRHLLQVGFVDTWLGELLEHLRTLGLYERALLILTADHGTSFRPGDFSRWPTQTTFQDIMPVPLFIKAPFQAQGRIDDRPTETVDILPSLADLLAIELPWAVDGRSAFGSPTERIPRIYRSPGLHPAVFPGLVEARRRAVARQYRLFGSGSPVLTPSASGPHSSLVGQSVDEVGSVGDIPVQITFDRPETFTNVDLESDFIPAYITGQVSPPTSPDGQPVWLAVAVNGRIQAVTRPWREPISGRQGEWSAVVPETAFRAGHNTVEVLMVVDAAGQLSLARAK